jgi:3-oxoacyl-[acyl-carrier protein] reductase
MDLGIAGKRALVVGSSSGIGSAIAAALGAEGVDVIVHGRNRDDAEGVRARIEEQGGRASFLLAALDDQEAVGQLAQDALRGGPVDILVNCAGAAPTVYGWFDAPDGAWLTQFQLSTFYAVQLIRAIVPGMRDRGWGRVLNVSSATAYMSKALHPEYAAAKLALHSITATLSTELGDSGVTANTLVSGAVGTPNTLGHIKNCAAAEGFTETGAALEKRVLEDVWKANIPMARLGLVEEVASAACFLVSARASYVTGAALRVDGGGTGCIA